MRNAVVTLTLCAAAALVEGFDNQSMGVAAPRVIAEFGLSAGQAAVIFSAATLGLFLGAGVGGRLADVLGRKRALTSSLFLFGTFSIVTSFANDAGFLLFARFLTGLGLGGAMPNFISLSSESTHPDRRVSAVTVIMAAMPLGGACAGLMALGAQFGLGWRAIFLTGGVVPIVLALAMKKLLPDRGPEGQSAGRLASPPVAPVITILFREGRASTTLLLWASFFFTQLVLLLMLNWLPSLMVGLGFSRTQASWASVCFNLSGSLGAVVLGYLHAGERRRVWVVVTYCGMAAALGTVASVGGVFALAALACSLAGIFIIGAQLILFALAPLYYRTSIRGTGVGAAVAMGRLGSVVGPLFAGGLLASGGSSASVLLAIVPFVAVAGGAALGLTWRPRCDE